MKFKLKRIKRPTLAKNPKAPDYDAIFETPRGRFYALGWLKDLSSDMDIKITLIDTEWLKNKYNMKRYNEWISNGKRN